MRIFRKARPPVPVSDLVRLPDPSPDAWLSDTAQTLVYTGGQEAVYGNFWAAKVCTSRPHDWRVLKVTDTGSGYPREVRRCRRCGSQVHQYALVPPPYDGRL